jgi:hypothetical protein
MVFEAHELFNLRGISMSGKARLMAASLNRKQYLTLRNTVRILSGVPLDDDQQKRVREFHDVVDAYEEMHRDAWERVHGGDVR